MWIFCWLEDQFHQIVLNDANKDGPERIQFVKVEDLVGLKIQAYVNDST